MTESESRAFVPTVGDVLVFPIERIDRYGACQVVAADETERLATVAVLAWTGAAVPDVTALAGVPRMVKDFMFWRPEEVVMEVALPGARVVSADRESARDRRDRLAVLRVMGFRARHRAPASVGRHADRNDLGVQGGPGQRGDRDNSGPRLRAQR